MAFLRNKKARSVITPGAAGKGLALRQAKGVGIALLLLAGCGQGQTHSKRRQEIAPAGRLVYDE